MGQNYKLEPPSADSLTTDAIRAVTVACTTRYSGGSHRRKKQLRGQEQIIPSVSVRQQEKLESYVLLEYEQMLEPDMEARENKTFWKV